MKHFTYLFLIFLGLWWTSCKKIDNFPMPSETIKGKVVDVVTGEPVLTDQGSEGTRVRLMELSWKGSANPEPFDFFCMKEGIFQNTKIFKGTYNIRVDGAFIPIVRINANGDTLADESKTLEINGVTDVEFKVQPFLKIEWVGTPTVANGKVSATIKVTRAVSRADFKAKIAPMGNYSDQDLDDMLYITDVRLFVSESPYVGFREKDDRFTTIVNFDKNNTDPELRDFEPKLGMPYTITSQNTIPAGRTVFIRAAARINYATENIKRHNYNEAIRVDMP